VIDWWLVARSATWIVGASIVLSAWSYYHWIAAMGTMPRAEAFRQPLWIFASGMGALLFCIGFATSGSRWDAILFGALALIAAVRVWRGIQSTRWNRHP
jgi:predicted Abi (CAAX) family protease